MIFGSAEAVLDERFRKVFNDGTKPLHSHVKLIVVANVTPLKHGEQISTLIQLTLLLIRILVLN